MKQFADYMQANYFEQYKVLENKKVEIDNFQDKAAALKIIEEAIKFYKESFQNDKG